MDCFQVAGISIGVEWENEEGKFRCYGQHDCSILPRIMEAFRNRLPESVPDMRVRVLSRRRCAPPPELKNIYEQSFYRKGNDMAMIVRDPYAPEVPGYTLTMSDDYSRIDYTPHTKEYEHYDLQWLMYPFEGRVLYKSGIVLHGAAVEYQNRGLIFTGLSGAGKSTQAHLWQKHRNALILNGDCPAIFAEDGIPRVFGTPWCGSSGEAINRNAPLDAVVLVKQGETNALRELTGDNAYFALLANVFHSNFDSRTLDLSIANLKKFSDHIRVFELTCTISEAAVEAVEKALY
jgi:hypothetical protein